MKKVLLLITAIAFSAGVSAQIVMAKTCVVSFFSASPLENIEAINKASKGIVSIKMNNEIMDKCKTLLANTNLPSGI